VGFFDLFKRSRPLAGASAAVPVRQAQRATDAELLPRPQAGAGDGEGAHGDMLDRRERERRNARPGTRILVVDDSPTIVALLKRMLVQNHFEVLVAYDGESALEIAHRERPDLIFLDIVLPGIDGFSALRKLRRDEATRNVPIIMISGNAQATEQFYVQRIGADDFMKKPFSRAEVFSRIEHLLDEQGVPRHASRRTEAPAATR
jgi:twitching motility two-component system response regulator PilH